MACNKKEPGLDGGFVRWFYFSFRRPGDYRYHHFAIPIIPKSCKKKVNGKQPLGDTSREVAIRTGGALRGAMNRGAANQGNRPAGGAPPPEGELNPGAQGGIKIGHRVQHRKIDALTIQFDNVCCVNSGADAGKARALVFAFPKRRRRRGPDGGVTVTDPPRGKTGLEDKEGKQGKYAPWQDSAYPWRWINLSLRGDQSQGVAYLCLVPDDFGTKRIGDDALRLRHRRNSQMRTQTSPNSMAVVPFEVVTTSPKDQISSLERAMRRSGLFRTVETISDGLQFEYSSLASSLYSGFGVVMPESCGLADPAVGWEIGLTMPEGEGVDDDDRVEEEDVSPDEPQGGDVALHRAIEEEDRRRSSERAQFRLDPD